jgi:hypothetical protein
MSSAGVFANYFFSVSAHRAADKTTTYKGKRALIWF